LRATGISEPFFRTLLGHQSSMSLSLIGEIFEAFIGLGEFFPVG